jgi:hypothetical protein
MSHSLSVQSMSGRIPGTFTPHHHSQLQQSMSAAASAPGRRNTAKASNEKIIDKSCTSIGHLCDNFFEAKYILLIMNLLSFKSCNQNQEAMIRCRRRRWTAFPPTSIRTSEEPWTWPRNSWEYNTSSCESLK